MTSGRGGEWASMYAMGVPFVQTWERQVGRRSKYDVPPSLANMSKIIPPASADPSLYPPDETKVIIIIFSQEEWLIEIKYIEKGVSIEDVD